MLKNNTIVGYGIRTENSDSLQDIISYQHLRDTEELKKLRDQHRLEYLKNNSFTRSQETKASLMRNKAIKNKLMVGDRNDKDERYLYKLKQFINIPSSDYIRNVKKTFKPKREAGYDSEHYGTANKMTNYLLQKQSKKSAESVGRIKSRDRYSEFSKTSKKFPDINNQSFDSRSRRR